MKGHELYRWFWMTMAERIGPRWYDERGLHATTEWKNLLDQYSHEHIRRALETNPVWDYPPTHGRVAKLFADTAGRIEGQAAEDIRRRVWRSNIAAEVRNTGALVRLWSYGTRLEDVAPELMRQIGPKAEELCEEIVQREKRLNGASPRELYEHVSHEVFQLLSRLHERDQLERWERRTARE